MRKILPISIVVVLVLSGFGVAAISNNQNHRSMGKTVGPTSLDDELDQSQTQFDDMGLGVGYDYYYGFNFSGAQSFIPQKSILTRVELFIASIGDAMSKPYVLAIRKELNGENLILVSVNHNQIPYGEPTWIEFDFDDIPVVPGETYYMVSYTTAIYWNLYLWGGSDDNPYPNGLAFISIDEGQSWDGHPDVDACFKTYGKSSDLEIIKITGGLSKVCAEIKNNFGSDVENVNWSITVEGGILGRINVVTDDTIDVLANDDVEIVCTDKLVFGLGPIEITATAESDEIDRVTRKAEGFVLLFLIIIR